MKSQKMPVLFVGHGSPMNAVEDNEFNRAWFEMGKTLPRPEAILCISAHWETSGTEIMGAERPPMIYDFSGFPQELYDVVYPAPGSPALARRVQELVRSTKVRLDPDRGYDHGAWSVLCRMFPSADIPVVQLSLDGTKDAAFHYKLGGELKPLRDEGILIMGNGNIVHNLRRMVWGDVAHDWAVDFDKKIQEAILAGDDDSVIHYEKFGEAARLAVPTPDHFWPLLYALGLRDKGEKVRFFSEKVSLGSMSMRSLVIG